MSLSDHTEPPLSFRFAALLYSLSALVGKRVWVDLGDRKTYPVLSILLIGLSGLGKSTCINQAREVIENASLDSKPFIANLGTREKLLRVLELFPRIAVLASELSAQLGRERYLESLIPTLTDLSDLPDIFHSLGSLKNGEVIIRNPQYSLFGGTTKDWLEDQMPASAMSGGWLPRHVIFFEDKKHQTVPIPRHLLGEGGLERLEERKKEYYRKINDCVKSFSGRIDFKDSHAEERFVEWVKNFQIADANLAPFQERGREHILKIATLVALSCHERAISAEHLEAAIAILEYSHGRLREVATRLTPLGKVHAQVLKNIQKRPDGISRVEVRRLMLNTQSSKETDKIIDSLLSCERIVEKSAKLFAL